MKRKIYEINRIPDVRFPNSANPESDTTHQWKNFVSHTKYNYENSKALNGEASLNCEIDWSMS